MLHHYTAVMQLKQRAVGPALVRQAGQLHTVQELSNSVIASFLYHVPAL
jgi:hypothetical protein